MLWLLLTIAGERYALETTSVLEVLPWMPLNPIHPAPNFVAGMFHYHQHPIPVIDLAQILHQRPSQLHICTRLIVMRSPSLGTDRTALLVEQVTKTRKLLAADQSALTAPAIPHPWISTLLPDPQGVIQCLQPKAFWATLAEHQPVPPPQFQG
jgi:chemotaxis-related protein WspB